MVKRMIVVGLLALVSGCGSGIAPRPDGFCELEYDSVGRVSSEACQGITYWFSYNGLGDIDRIISYPGNTCSYTYNQHGAVASESCFPTLSPPE